jgi:uncharacterized protein
MSWRENKTAAYVGPFVVFMVLQQLVGLVKIDNPLLPWWRSGPEHWVYPLQTVVCLSLIAWWWKHYDFRPLRGKEIGLGLIVGIVGIVIWVVPSVISDRLGMEVKLLGMISRSGPGYDPSLLEANPVAYWASVSMRFVRMTIAVAFLEELMMRGFLWRYLARPDGDFTEVPFGVWSRAGVIGSILAFTLGHGVADLLVCFIYGILISWLAWKTKSLGACVICHSISNLLLGIYVMQTKQWGFW